MGVWVKYSKKIKCVCVYFLFIVFFTVLNEWQKKGKDNKI
jgi:hypothetical protein